MQSIDNENKQTHLNSEGYLIKYEDVTRSEDVTELSMSYGANEIYPGMLLVVDSQLDTSRPTESGLSRGKLKIVMDIGNITLPKGNTRIVKADEHGNIMSAVNQAINEMMEDFRASGKMMTANFEERTTSGESQEEQKIKVGCTAKFAGIEGSADFERNKSSFSMQYLTEYTQLFFTVTAQLDRTDYSSLFGEDVTVDDVKKSFGSGKPIIFVESVKYGRQIYLNENVSGSNQSMVQTLKVAGYGCSIDQSYSNSKCQLQYTKRISVRGGGLTNTGIREEAVVRKTNESDLDYCRRQTEAVRDAIDKYKSNDTVKKLDGTIEYNAYAVPLSFSAEYIAGVNKKKVSFLKQGQYKVKRLIPNRGITINVFNCLKENNIVASGWFTKYDANGNELSTMYDLQSSHPVVGYIRNDEPILTGKLIDGGTGDGNGRVYCKKFMTPPFDLPKNVYRVCLKIRHRDNNKRTFKNTYILPYGDIMAGYMRGGKGGGESVNWFYNNDGDPDEIWYNGGKD